MKVLFAAAIVAGATFVLASSSTALPLAPQDNPSLVQTVRDPTCNAPQRNARCKWYGMPGVHTGPKWLRQSQPGHHYHHRRHVKKPIVHKSTAPKPGPNSAAPAPTTPTPAPAPQTTTPPATTPPTQQQQ
jgi:hypothetical protein